MEQNDDATESSEEISPGKNYKRELGELNYTNGCGTDCGFWKHLVNSKYYYQCGFFERNSDGEFFWCIYDQRTDHYQDYKGVHIHKTKKLIENGPFDKHFTATSNI